VVNRLGGVSDLIRPAESGSEFDDYEPGFAL